MENSDGLAILRNEGLKNMTLPEKLLNKLVCPKCQGSLTYDPEGNRLTCPKCQLRYRVTDDIPVLLLDEAEKLE